VEITVQKNTLTVLVWKPFIKENPMALVFDEKIDYNKDLCDVFLIAEHVLLQHEQLLNE
jgi:hypothetical protein